MRQSICALLLFACALAVHAQLQCFPNVCPPPPPEVYPLSGPAPHTVAVNYSMTAADQILVVNCATGCTIILPDCTKLSSAVSKFSVTDANPMTLTGTPQNIVYVQPFAGQSLASGNPYVLALPGQTTRFEAIISSGGCWWTF